MITKFDTKFPENFVSRVLEITAILTVVFYITFSFTKRFIGDEKFYWISIVLTSANLLILLELIYMVKTNKITSTKKEYRNLVCQIILNVSFVIFIFTYLF
jgi:hypothetical protein